MNLTDESEGPPRPPVAAAERGADMDVSHIPERIHHLSQANHFYHSNHLIVTASSFIAANHFLRLSERVPPRRQEKGRADIRKWEVLPQVRYYFPICQS